LTEQQGHQLFDKVSRLVDHVSVGLVLRMAFLWERWI
jgi:hypothetical protein